MREKIENRLTIEVVGAPDLTKCQNLVVWIHNGSKEYAYTPTPLSPTELLVVVPYEHAMQWDSKLNAEVQLAGTDENGEDFASDPTEEDVGRLINEEGYNGSN